MRYLSKPVVDQNGSATSAIVGDGWLPSKFPAVWEYLAVSVWDDGSARETATLLLFCEDGQVKVCLNDREAQRSAWASGRTLDDALEALEGGLEEGSTSWRKSVRKRPRG